MNGLPDYKLLKNEIGTEFNSFNIIRGKEYIKFGEDVWVGYFCLLDGSGGLEIGNKVSISSGTHIYTHDSSNYRYNDLKKSIDGSHIERAAVKIGNNVIIGALSLVNKDIPNDCVAVGSPIRIIKRKNNIFVRFINKFLYESK